MAKVDPRNSSSVSFDADSQAVMDAELEAAAGAGLNFWAYDTYCVWPTDRGIPQCEAYWNSTKAGGPVSYGYKPTNPDYGLKLHLKSTKKHLMNFSLVLLGAPPAIPTMRQRCGFSEYCHYEREKVSTLYKS